jgi:Ser/Thr protein kinase RdoA (MazF antagonist)
MDEPTFDHLSPELVLELVEDALDVRCSNICRPLNSYINRVYELATEEGEGLVAKFYRPHRWTTEALLDELTFLNAMHEDEIRVIPPLPDADGQLLHIEDDMRFSVFPKMGGRIVDEPTPEQWVQLGHLLARVHGVGERAEATHRVTMTPDDMTEQQIQYILEADVLPEDLSNAWEDRALETLDHIAPLFDETLLHRIHGDLHVQNLIHRPDEGFYLIDFDDMAMGPPVQDLWMLLPGRLQDSIQETSLFIEGYETFRPLDRDSLRLIEPLRFMRFIHFTSWCVMQRADGGFARLAPDWGSHGYWQSEITSMRTQQREIEDALAAPLPHL